MKIIEAMKKVKDLQRKADDIIAKVKSCSADLNIETPVYPDQKAQVEQWIQSYSDILKEVLKLRFAIQRTNIGRKVKIELDGKEVEKTITEWIHRRKDLAKRELQIWESLTDKGLREGNIPSTSGGVSQPVTIRRYYDPKVRDEKIDLFRTEPMAIDAALEVVNAITDLVE